MRTMQRRTVAICVVAVLIAGLVALAATGGTRTSSKTTHRAFASVSAAAAGGLDPAAPSPYKASPQREARALAASHRIVKLKTPGAPAFVAAYRGWIWVGGHRGEHLLKIDPTTNKVVHSYNVKQSICGVSGMGADVIVGNCGPGATILNAATGRFRFFLHFPEAYAGGSLWEPNPGNGNWVVQRIDPKSHVVLKRFGGIDNEGPGSVDDGSLWLPGLTTLSRIDMRNDTLTIIPLPGAKKDPSPYQGYSIVWRTAVTPGTVWIPNPAGLYRVDERTNKATLVPGIRVGKLDEFGNIDIVGVGNSVFVRLSATEVARIDAATGRVTARYRAPRTGGGGGIEVADGSVWITNFGDDTTWRVPIGSTNGT